MKNRNLFMLMAALMPLISCCTMIQSASYGGQFRNSVYYTPQNNRSGAVAQTQQQPVQQNGEYGQESRYDAASNTRTIYMGESNEVTIDYDPGVTYTIVDDRESYAARLRKFDSPTYNVNINFVEPSYWWDFHFGWYSPYGISWRTGWYNSWWNRHFAWYGPGWHWSDPWYTGPYWAWYNPWWDPWWGPVHRPGLHYPPHRPGHGPGYLPGHGRPSYGRDVYYGKRNSNSTYRDINRGSVSQGRNNGVSGKPNSGSITRRPSVNNKNTTPPPQSKSDKSVVNNNRNNSGSSIYNRSSNSHGSNYNRSSSGSSGGSRSQGGSSYRRR